MFSQLIHIDKQWLLAINSAHSTWADQLMWIVSQGKTWIPLYAVLIVWLVILFWHQRKTIRIRAGRRGVVWDAPVVCLALFMFAIAVGGSDLLCAQVIKPLVARTRPTHDAEIGALMQVVNGYRGGLYGFCSNHAANTMACATLFAAIATYRKPLWMHLIVTLPMMLWVALNCYSRMYLGVHYPLDIAAGLMVGMLMALVVWMFGKQYLFPHEERERRGAEG